MNKLSMQFAIVGSIIAIFLPGGTADAKDEIGCNQHSKAIMETLY